MRFKTWRKLPQSWTLYEKGEGVKQSYQKADQFYSKACDLEVAEGCYNLGASYYLGNHTKQDYKKANELFSKTCDLGYSIGCYALGFWYASGEGIEQDFEKAINYILELAIWGITQDAII